MLAGILTRAKNRFPANATNIVVIGLIIVVDLLIIEVQFITVVGTVLGRRPIVVGSNEYSYAYPFSKVLTLFRKTF